LIVKTVWWSDHFWLVTARLGPSHSLNLWPAAYSMLSRRRAGRDWV